MPFQPKEWEPNPRWVPKEQRAKAATPDGSSITTRAPRGPSVLSQSLPLLVVSLVATLAVAVFVFFGLDVWNRDALARTIDSHNVLFSRDPHLGAIGFTWPPLPTAMRLPLLPVLKPFGLAEFVGPLTSAIATAGSVALLDRILRHFAIERTTRLVWIAVTLANPVTVLHFTNGTAEAPFTFLFLMVVLASLHLADRPERAVQGMGLAAGAALWVRYEALAIVATAVGTLIVVYWLKRGDRAWRGRNRIGSLLITLVMPPIFFGGLWLLFNWTIQGNPLFFYTGPYSIQGALDVARNDPEHQLAFAYGSVFGTLRYFFQRLLEVSFLYPILVTLALYVSWRRRDITGVVLVFLTGSTLLLQVYQTFTGSIAEWLRYWVYLPVLSLVLLGWLAQQLKLQANTPGRNAARWAVVPILILATNAVAFTAMRSDMAGFDEQIFAYELTGQRDEANERRAFYPDREVVEEIANYVRDLDGIILVDIENGGPLAVTMEKPGRLAVNSDRDFGNILDNPARTVQWMLLPDLSSKSDLAVGRDQIYGRFTPGLYDGAAWLTLEREFEGDLDWRLYRVIAAPEVSPAAAPTATPPVTPGLP